MSRFDVVVRDVADASYTATIDTGGICIMDALHHQEHLGKLHDAGITKANVGTGDVANIAFTVGASSSSLGYRGLHTRLDCNVIGGIKVELGTVASYTGGSAITPRNLNSNFTSSMTSTFADTATLTTFTPVKTFYFGSTSGGAVRGSGSITGIQERLFAPGSKWAYQITPLVAGTYYDIDFYVYERELA